VFQQAGQEFGDSMKETADHQAGLKAHSPVPTIVQNGKHREPGIVYNRKDRGPGTIVDDQLGRQHIHTK